MTMTNKPAITIGICARNAAATIERCIASVIPEVDAALLLVDDHSTDDTVNRARKIGGRRLRVVHVEHPEGGLALARKTGLATMDTEMGAWLDADDEWIPGRAGRLVEGLESGADVATEPIELFDGVAGTWLRTLEVPSFLASRPIPARLFERNYLPCDAQVGFRVKVFQDAGGYDGAIDVAESYDILLRAIAQRARFHFGTRSGYRMYAYPDSLSRQVNRMRAGVRRILKKHDYEEVRRLCLEVGHPSRVAAWILVSMAMFRNEWEAALQFLDEASPTTADPNELLEAGGPWPFKEGWRRAFQRGTILLLAGGSDAEAADELQKAISIEPVAEVCNNLGVALTRLRQTARAEDCFAQAEALFPGYLDARMNRKNASSLCITTHPLRRHASRSEYAG